MPSLQVHLVTIYKVPVVMVVVIPLPTLSCSKDKKALPTHGSDWPDQTASRDVQKHPLTILQGSPTTPEPPPAETEAVMITKQGAVDVPTDPAPPSQM